MCDSHDIEDEYHFIMNCSAYDNLRNLYLPHLSNLHKNAGAWDGLRYFIVALPEPSI